MTRHPTDAPNRRRLAAIAEILDVSVEAFGEPSEHCRTLELIRLWSALSGQREQDAALAYLRVLGHGIPD